MSGLRYHGLALLTSVVTLGVGVALGVGPITDHQDGEQARRTLAGRQQQSLLVSQLKTATGQAARDQSLAASLAVPLVRNQLSGRTVLLVAAPGAARSTLRRTSAVVRKAGGKVGGKLTLRPDYVDPAKAQSPLEDLALRLVPPDVRFADGSTSIERVGTVLARSTVTKDASAVGEIDQQAAELIAGLDELKAISLVGDPGRLADLAVVVAGPSPRGDDARTGARDALLGLVAALDATSRGTVVVGSGERGGLVAQVRAAGSTRGASTVDTAGSVAGDLATVLALAEQATGTAGDYGAASGADALVPALKRAAARD